MMSVRDQVEARRGGAAEGTVDHLKDRVAVAALAVDHHQRVIGAEAAQAGRQREARHVGALRLRLERGDQLGQRLVEVGLADAGQRIFRQELDRRGGLVGAQAGGAGAGDDDRVGVAIGLTAGGGAAEGSSCASAGVDSAVDAASVNASVLEKRDIGDPLMFRTLPFVCPAIGLPPFPSPSVGKGGRPPAVVDRRLPRQVRCRTRCSDGHHPNHRPGKAHTPFGVEVGRAVQC